MRDFMQLGADRFIGSAVQVTVETTDSAEHALVYLARQSYQLVLVDLYLPGLMDGAALVRTLRETQTDLPVIGFSVGGEAARTAFLAAGADLFLDKPVVVKDVFSTLERLTLMRARSTA
jgi:CheY-like chemotaxis protein